VKEYIGYIYGDAQYETLSITSNECNKKKKTG
jgi:hypothetical protein